MEIFFSIFNIFDKSIAYIYPLIPILGIFIMMIRQSPDFSTEVFGENALKYKKQRISYQNESNVIFFWFITMIVAAIPLAFFNVKCEAYIYKVLEKNNISIICTVSMTFTAMVFAMAFVLILREKNFYIIFSLSDVLEQYNFGFWIRNLFYSCIMVSLAVLSLLDGELVSYFDVIRFMALEYAFIINIISLFCVFRVIFLLLFSSSNKELVLLNKLYQLLGMSNLDTTHMKERWDDKTAIEINFEYLYNQYFSLCEKINVSKIETIFYSSWLDKEESRRRVKENALCRYLLIVLIFTIAWGLMKFSLRNENEKVVGTIIQAICFFIDTVIPCTSISCIQPYLIKIFGDSEGYEFRGSKSRFVTEISYKLRGRKYVKYVQSMNSLIAFISIALSRDVSFDHMNAILKEYIEQVIHKYRTPVGLLPFWVIGYMIYALCDEENNEVSIDKSNIDYLREIYRELKLDRNQERDFRRMVYSQIGYVERAKNSLNCKEKWKYMQWLCGKSVM
ncbi:MAG: hypothetical protein J1E98_09495 [Lachnospiraceae bacterium]|nr:hypothetical protein [Lachnospiraceae bacterium]